MQALNISEQELKFSKRHIIEFDRRWCSPNPCHPYLALTLEITIPTSKRAWVHWPSIQRLLPLSLS